MSELIRLSRFLSNVIARSLLRQASKVDTLPGSFTRAKFLKKIRFLLYHFSSLPPQSQIDVFYRFAFQLLTITRDFQYQGVDVVEVGNASIIRRGCCSGKTAKAFGDRRGRKSLQSRKSYVGLKSVVDTYKAKIKEKRGYISRDQDID
jgi:hypothetical protein